MIPVETGILIVLLEFQRGACSTRPPVYERCNKKVFTTTI